MDRSPDAAGVTDPLNELGQTQGRVWADIPPPGSVFFYRITAP